MNPNVQVVARAAIVMALVVAVSNAYRPSYKRFSDLDFNTDHYRKLFDMFDNSDSDGEGNRNSLPATAEHL